MVLLHDIFPMQAHTCAYNDCDISFTMTCVHALRMHLDVDGTPLKASVMRATTVRVRHRKRIHRNVRATCTGKQQRECQCVLPMHARVLMFRSRTYVLDVNCLHAYLPRCRRVCAHLFPQDIASLYRRANSGKH
jgi:hypothetical protein